MKLEGPKESISLKLSKKDQSNIEKTKLILAGDFDQFATEKIGVTSHRAGLSITSLMLKKFAENLRQLGLAADVKLDELDGLSIKDIENASELAIQKRNEMRGKKLDERKKVMKSAEPATLGAKELRGFKKRISDVTQSLREVIKK